MKLNGMSLANKVYLALSAIFTLVLVVAVLVSVESEWGLSRTMLEQQLKDKADGYLDSLNIMMLTGTLATREVAREKMMADDSVSDARIMRTSAIDNMYGKGFDHEYPQDDLDRRGLAGETLLVDSTQNGEHTLTYIQPVIAQSNYRGTNCLTCHQVEEGTQLGAIRIDYSLTQLDEQIQKNIMTMAVIQGLMFLAALGLISILMRRFLLKPIKIIHRTIRNIEKNSDLNQQIPVTSNDELGATTNALNRMLIQFRDTMSEVVTATSSLDSASQSIDSSSNQALDAAVAQRDKTNHINDQIQQLKHSIDVVKNNTDTSSQASDQAMQVSQQGTQKTQQAINGINSMTEAIDQAVKVINNLDERSTNVGSVLDVIKGIAEQTNLLALNAAIEAARAGESGRGFAVVADEVRSLAIKTHESTQEIEEMIGQLQSEAQGAVGAMDTAQEKANEGVEQVQQASQALAEMANQVEHMNSLNHETLQAVDSQVSIGNQVEAGIENIAGHADNSAGMAQHNADVAHQLVTLSGNLNKLVQRFRL